MLLGWKAKGFYQRRLHLLTLILLDTGCRISEATGIHVQDVDLDNPDNLLLTVTGEGSKQRKVPFSFELRKALFRHTRESCPQPYMLLLGILPARFDVWVLPQEIVQTLCHVFARAEIRDKGMASSG
jgi:integrase